MPSIIVLKSYRIRILNRDNNFPTIGSNPTTWLRSQQVILFSKPIRETLLSNTFIFESTTLVSYVLTWFFLLYIDSLASLMYFQGWFNVIGCWQQLSSFISVVEPLRAINGFAWKLVSIFAWLLRRVILLS